MKSSTNSGAWKTALSQAIARSSETVSRLVNSAGTSPELRGLVVDRFERCALLHTYEPVWKERVADVTAFLSQAGISDAVLWDRDKDPRATTKKGAESILGNPAPTIEVPVDGVRLHLKPFKTASGGIFLDTRDIRRELTRTSTNKRVLNLFCFTGSLGLAAAVGGAREVIQVDISQSILEWAKENAALQAQLNCAVKYFTDDALDVLNRAVRRREKGTDTDGFDTIIIDPPAFGTTGGKRFDLSAQIHHLLEGALKAAAKQSTIYLMCNETAITPDVLRALVSRVATPPGLRLEDLRAPIETHPGKLEELPMMRGIAIRIVP